VTHESLAPGCGCPDCCRGKLYDLKEPASILRIVGQPALAALRWDCQRLRCNTCGKVYTAKAPQEAQGPKFDETAVSMLALCHYDAGLPLNRIERLQHNLQTPIPSSTQWDVLNESASTFKPVFDEMARQAAQGQVVHDDDTFVRILALMGKRRAELLKKGELPSPERTGLFTTAIVSITDSAPIALFYTGRKYAGENLADLLKVREADLGPPILMSDALDSRNVPKGHTVIESNCAAHARRGFVDQYPNFPAECKHVLEELRKIFVVDAQCQKAGLSPEERLRVHQRDSGPVMEALHAWMTNELATKRAEPNSGLGHAYNYMLKRWHKFTLFLHKAGAPIDNNIAYAVHGIGDAMPRSGLCRVEIARASNIVGSRILGDVGVGIVTDSGGRRGGCPKGGTVLACRRMDRRGRGRVPSAAYRRGGRSASSLSIHGQARVQSP
jgi:transposase